MVLEFPDYCLEDIIIVRLIELGKFWSSGARKQNNFTEGLSFEMKRQEDGSYSFIDSSLPWVVFDPKTNILEYYR